jgi:two-component system phosphate regulon sensor histidine kinase PhoR
MFYTIRARIGVSYILLFLLVMFGLTVYLVNFVEQISIADLDSHLEDDAQFVAVMAAPLLQAEAPAEQIDELAKQIGARIQSRVTIIDSEGIVLGESHNDRTLMENHAGRTEIVHARNTGKGSATRFSDTLGYDMFYVAVPILTDGKIIGFSRIALSLETVQNNITRLQQTLIFAAIFSAILAGLLAIWISNRTTYPLSNLILAANQMAAGRLDSRLIPTTQDEIGQLTQTFNEMAAQLNAKINDLEAERSRIAAVLSAMTDGVIIINYENRIQLINPSAQAMFSIEEMEAIGKSLFEVVRHHQIEEVLTDCRESGDSQSTTMEITARKLYMQATATPLGPAQPGNTLLLFQNLTRIHRLETIRQDFISNVSHELRTPLASLKAITETLQEGALEDPPAARRFLSRMENELDALHQMVEELLELSRIESGRVPLKMSPTSPRQLIQAAVDRLSSQAVRAGLTVEIDCSPDLPKLMADPSRLAQVIINLLHNAIKFTPPDGKICISAQQQKMNILFFVQDNGIGIPMADLSRIFERFYKTDRARSGGGTGLGLAIARHLVEAHGGTIWVESMENVGSTFYFTIPLAE